MITTSSTLADWLLGDTTADTDVALPGSGSYGWLRARVDDLAAELVERHGREGAVLVHAPRTPDGVIGVLAVIVSGLTLVFVPPNADERMRANMQREVRPVAEMRGMQILSRTHSAPPDTLLSPEASVVIYTSGTTALPKGVQLSERNIIANASAVSEFVGLTSDDAVSLVLPFEFSYGFSMLLIAVRARARMVLHNDFRFPARCLQTMREQATTVFAGVPFHYQRLLALRRAPRGSTPLLRLALVAGGAMSADLLTRLRETFPYATPLLMYGQTEATARLSYLPPAELESRPGSIGRGMAGVELVVRDRDGRPVRPGEIGEVYVRGESVMIGYVGDTRASADVLTPWGMRTRDLATVDDDDYIYLQGRIADFAKVHGVRVSLPEIEAVIEARREVLEALARSEPTPSGDETIVLDIAVDPAMSDSRWQMLRCQIERDLPGVKRPKRVERVAAVGRTSTGKKLRHLGLR
jgi:long-chain acyl-CoA synthetase